MHKILSINRKINEITGKGILTFVLVCVVFICALFLPFSVSKAQVSSALFCNTQKGMSFSNLEREWKALTVRDRRSWSEWAGKSPVLLKSGQMHHVSAEKAFEIILNNRSLGGEALNASVPPREAQWFPGAFSLRDAGPFTENDGYMGFRADKRLATSTKWFVCATPLVNGNEKEKKIEKQLNFIKSFSLGPMEIDDLTPDFASMYRSLLGSFNSPGGDSEWWVPEKFIWFQLYEYDDGQLSPGLLMKGRIQVEL